MQITMLVNQLHVHVSGYIRSTDCKWRAKKKIRHLQELCNGLEIYFFDILVFSLYKSGAVLNHLKSHIQPPGFMFDTPAIVGKCGLVACVVPTL